MILLLISYLIGSIPVARLFGKRGYYSASEIIRKVGWQQGIVVALADILKGVICVQFGLLAGLSAVTGQTFSVFNGFKGGGGLFTSYGALLVINPYLATLAALTVIPSVYFKQAGIGVGIAWILTSLIALYIEDYDYTIFAAGHTAIVSVAWGMKKWM